MKVISHRGYWGDGIEKNSEAAFKRSFELGYGTETDIRDCAGVLVISHDMPTGGELMVKEFFHIYKSSGCQEVLALNIKSDGLQEPLLKLIEEYQITNYFLFDMSVPDTVSSLKKGLCFYTRQSEYEQTCSLYHEADGVWLDEFYSNWISEGVIVNHVKNHKKVCIVSPELHGRDPLKRWGVYRDIESITSSENVVLCTDNPEQAGEYFYAKN